MSQKALLSFNFEWKYGSRSRISLNVNVLMPIFPVLKAKGFGISIVFLRNHLELDPTVRPVRKIPKRFSPGFLFKMPCFAKATEGDVATPSLKLRRAM